MIRALYDYLVQKGLPHGLQPESVKVSPDPTWRDGYSLHIKTRGGPFGKADFLLMRLGRVFPHILEEDFPDLYRDVCKSIEKWWSDLSIESFLPTFPDWPLQGEYEWRRAKAFESALFAADPLKDTGWKVDSVRCTAELSAALLSNPSLNCPKFHESFIVTLRTPWGDTTASSTGMHPGGSALEVFKGEVEKLFYETVLFFLPIGSVGSLSRPNLLLQKALNYVVRGNRSAEAVDARFHEVSFRCRPNHLSTSYSLDVTAEYTYLRDPVAPASDSYLLGKSQMHEEAIPNKPLGNVVNELVSQLFATIGTAALVRPTGPVPEAPQPSPFWLDPQNMSSPSKPRYDDLVRIDIQKLIGNIDRTLIGRKLPAAWGTSCRQVESISCNSSSFDRTHALLEFTIKSPTSYPSIKYQVAIDANSRSDGVLEDLRAELVTTDRRLSMGARSFLDTRCFIEAEIARRLSYGNLKVTWSDECAADAELQVKLTLYHNSNLCGTPTRVYSVLIGRQTEGGVGKVIDYLCAQASADLCAQASAITPVLELPPTSVPSVASVVPGFTADLNGELFATWRELAVENFNMHRQLERLTRFDRSPVGPDARYEVDPSTAAWVPRPPPNESALRANIVTESVEFTRLTRRLRKVEQSKTRTR